MALATAPARQNKSFARCLRCATPLRDRQVCPCCGRDAAAPAAQTAEPQSKAPAAQARPAAKPAAKLCQMCLASVPAAEIQERDGKAVCAQCIAMLNKAPRQDPQATQPEAPQPAQAVPQPRATPAPVPAQRTQTPNEPAPESELKFDRYKEEQLKKKLTWVKVVLWIAAVVLLLTGAGTFFLGDFGESAARSNSAEEQALEIMEEAGSTAEETAARKAEEAAARAALMEAGSKLKLVAYAQFGIAFAFIVMAFLTNTYPFEISLAALLMYLALEAYTIHSDGEWPSLFGCLIIVVIAANLAIGVQAGLEIRKLRAARKA